MRFAWDVLRLFVLNVRVVWHEWRTRPETAYMKDGWRAERRSYREPDL